MISSEVSIKIKEEGLVDKKELDWEEEKNE